MSRNAGYLKSIGWIGNIWVDRLKSVTSKGREIKSNALTGGMETQKGHEDEPPYGWAGKGLYEQHPEYAPLGLNPLFEGPGMSGKGGNAQVTDYPKPFIIFPSVEAAMMYRGCIISKTKALRLA